MQDAIEKADVLIEALGWIREFRDKITVIKLGGSVMEDPEALRHLLVDIVFMETVGMRPIVVHGGGKAISRAMAEAEIEPRFIQGRRYTDEPTLGIVERVLAGEINEMLARQIEEFDGRAMPLNFTGETNNNVLYGERLTLSGDDGQEVDLGAVGQVTRVDRLTLDNLTYAGQGAGDSVDVRNGVGRAAQRKRRYGRYCCGPGRGGREVDFPQRYQRSASRQGGPGFVDSDTANHGSQTTDR